ncbi:MAG TPA: M20/M25/M40 family metallo-hydrolase [Streptosporangiaceae bacterium]|nr:M20/M25/M40 family metallo-hydrolase [Streptosporangiaceae bacterium]
MPVTKEQVIELLGAMVQIESVTPWLIPTGSGEGNIAKFIAEWLAGTGAEIEIVEVAPGRPNVLARLRGAGGGPTLCLNAHSDTVGYEGWPDEALVPRIDGDRMYGLGAADDKAGCAAGMLVLRSLAESGARLRGDLLVACVADEEGVSIGSEHLARQGGIDAAIVIEPQPFTHELVVEHQGFGWIDVTCHGRAAHGSAPDAGIDAIVHLAEVITRLHQLDRREFEANPSLLNGRTVFHTGTITGGTDYATYPSQAKLGIEIGTQPGEHLSDRVTEIEAIFAEVAWLERGFSGEVVVRLDREPFVAEGHEELQGIVVPAMASVLRRTPKVTGLNAWTDAALMQAAGIPTLLMGSSGGNFHTANEWASISELVKLCAILERVASQYLA